MPMVAMPRIPTRTMTATTIRITLRALLPPVGAVAGAVEVAPEIAIPAGTAAPHLLQNFVPGFRVAPQELQNAISHLVSALGKIVGASIPQIGNKKRTVIVHLKLIAIPMSRKRRRDMRHSCPSPCFAQG